MHINKGYMTVGTHGIANNIRMVIRYSRLMVIIIIVYPVLNPIKYTYS